MTTEQQKSFSELLKKLKFVAFSRQNAIVWRLSNDAPDLVGRSTKISKKSNKALRPLWALRSCELIERKGQYSILSADLSLNLVEAARRMAILERKFWGPRIVTDYVETTKGTLWCLYEFLNSRKAKDGEKRQDLLAPGPVREPISGMGGYQTRLAVSGGQVSLLISDHFGMGYIPPGFVQTALLFNAEVFGFRDKRLLALNIEPKLLSMHEWRMSAALLPLRVLLEECETETEVACLMDLWGGIGDGRGVIQAALAFDNLDYHLNLGTIEEIRSLPYVGTTIPNEVLESRERSADFGRVDVALSQGKYAVASKQMDEHLRESPRDLFLSLRMALLGLSGHRDLLRADQARLRLDMDQISQALDIDPDNKLLLSDVLKMATKANSDALALGTLSRLGALLSAQIPSIEALKTFDVVMVEMLGDFWQIEDPKKAEECYLRILQKKGDTPRILRKLIQLTRKMGLVDGENAYLERLSKVERRHAELAKIHLRLAELRAASPLKGAEAVELAMGALKLDGTLMEAAFLAANTLVKLGRSDEAIHLLDTRVAGQAHGATPKQLGKTQEIIGQIWLESKRRPDLALTRYEKAVDIDPSNTQAVRALQNLYRDKKDYKNLAKSLELEIDQQGLSLGPARIKELYDEIVALVRGPLSNPKKAYDLYLKLVAIDALDPQEIERVLRWGDIQIDWHDLYHRLIASRALIPEGERRGRFLSRMAEIARDKLGLSGLATQHLREALAEGWIDSRGFAFLTHELRISRDFSALAGAFEKRLPFVSDQEKIALMQEYFEIPVGLTDSRRDQLAVQCFVLDRSQDSLLHKRLSFYRGQDDVEGIFRLFELIGSIQGLTQFQKATWADVVIEQLSDCLDERRFDIAQGVFLRKLAFSEAPLEILKFALDFLKMGKDRTLMFPFVQQMIAVQMIPDLDVRVVAKVLQGHDFEVAQFERLLSLNCESPETAATHARISAHIFSRIDHSQLAEEMLGRVCFLTPCSEADLVELSSMVDKSRNWVLLADCYEAQIKFEDEKSRKLSLLFHLAQIYREKMFAFDKARSLVQMAFEFGAESFRAKRELAQIAIAASDIDSQKETITSLLYESQSTRDFGEFVRYFDRLVILGVDKVSLQRVVTSHLDYAMQKLRWNVVLQLVELAFHHKMSHWHIYKLAFLAGLNEGKIDGLPDLWWRGVAIAQNLTSAVDYIAETVSAAKDSGRIPLILECFQTALRRSAVDRLGPRGKKEILLRYAELLFDDDSKREQALPVYQEIFSLDPTDSRSWLPLYFVLNEFGTAQDTIHHLEAVVPKLLRDPRPLKSFPVTIEFLSEELSRLRQAKGGPNEFGSGRKMSLSQEELSPGVSTLNGRSPHTSSADYPSYADSGLPPLPDLFVAATGKDGAPAGRSLNLSAAPAELSGIFNDRLGASPPSRWGDDFSKYKIDEGQEGQGAFGSDPSLGIVSDHGPGDIPLEASTSHEMAMVAGRSFDGGGVALDLADLVLTGSSRDEPDLRLISRLELVPSDNAASFDLELGRGLEGLSDRRSAKEKSSPQDHLGGLPRIDLLALSESSSGLSLADSNEVDPAQPSSNLEVDGDREAEKNRANFVDVVGPGDQSVSLDVRGLVEPLLPMDRLVVGSDPDSAGLRSEAKAGPMVRVFDETGENMETSIVDGQKAIIQQTGIGLAERPAGQSDDTMSVMLAGDSYGAKAELIRPDLQEEVVNWRQVILTGDFNSDLTNKLLGQAFASELEKHVALQCVALMAGNVPLLEAGWHWRVWRHPKEYGYSLVGKGRFPRNSAPTLLQGSLLKLMLFVNPILVRTYPNKFGLDYLGIRLKTQPRTIEKLRKPLLWDQGFLESSGVSHFAKIMQKHEYLLFNIPGLGMEIFYDEQSKAFYFDEIYYKSRPSSHFFNRFLIVMLMVRSGFYVPLKLHPQREIHALLTRINEHIFGSRLAQITRSLMADKSSLGRMLSKSDSVFLKSYFEKRGVPSVEQIQNLLQAMQTHIHHRVLAETLDIIGFFESFLDRDLLVDPPGHSEVLNVSTKIRPLLEFITKLTV